MPSRDKIHFDNYSDQTHAKHQILSEYLKSYFIALKKIVDGFHYVDGFAGRGVYEGEVPGSSLKALEVMNECEVLQKSAMSLVENNEAFFHELKERLFESPFCTELAHTPYIRQGSFASYAKEILNHPMYHHKGMATFAFIDPCGLKGVRMDDVVEILKKPYGEVLLFFNYDAANRLVGGVLRGKHPRTVLEDIFGSEESVDLLIRKLNVDSGGADREMAFVKCFNWSVKRILNKPLYVLPFRFEAKNHKRTSHYLIHFCLHPLGFKLMKNVMWTVCNKQPGLFGPLEFRNVQGRRQLELLDPSKDAKIDEVKLVLEKGPRQVGQLIDSLVCRPTDTFSEGAYKKLLLEMESDGILGVYDNDMKVVPQSKRRKHKGNPTLGVKYLIGISS